MNKKLLLSLVLILGSLMAPIAAKGKNNSASSSASSSPRPGGKSKKQRKRANFNRRTQENLIPGHASADSANSGATSPIGSENEENQELSPELAAALEAAVSRVEQATHGVEAATTSHLQARLHNDSELFNTVDPVSAEITYSPVSTPIREVNQRNRMILSELRNNADEVCRLADWQEYDAYQAPTSQTQVDLDIPSAAVSTSNDSEANTHANGADASDVTASKIPTIQAPTPSMLHAHKHKAIGIVAVTAIATAYYKYVAPPLARRARAMQNGRMKNLLLAVSFAKKNKSQIIECAQ